MTLQPEKVTAFQRTVRFVVALGVFALGVAIAGYLIKTKPKTKKVPRENLGELVEVSVISRGPKQVRVEANGQVVPAQVVALSAEVGGRVVWVDEKLIPGSRVEAKRKLVRIDARDYKLALEAQRSMVNSALTALEVERSRKAIAEREWQLMGNGRPADALALRDPQLQSAEASVKAARSQLARAQLAAGKTVLAAPFNAIVKEKSADIGQLVGPQVPLVTLIGSDAYWVQVSVPIDRLKWLTIPGYSNPAPQAGEQASEGSTVRISQEIGSERICRMGRVLRLLGDLDPMGRMARVLVEIPDPLLEKADTARCAADPSIKDSDLPLLVGAYVTVAIEGKTVPDVVELPREAVRGGDRVYVMTDEHLLDIREVEIVWRQRDSVFVDAGLKAGDKVVTSPLPIAAQGMKLREPKTAAASAAASDSDTMPSGSGT